MLTQIEKLKHVGVFQNYAKTAKTSPFSEVNYFYGWNYSGKTTLSRIFSALSAGPSALNGYVGAEYAVSCSNGDVITHDSPACPYDVVVFNSDFVEENLSWNGESFDPVLLLGEESLEDQNKIDRNKSMVERLDSKSIKDKQRKLQDASNALSASKTQYAARIKSELKLSSEPFTATHLNSLLRRAEVKDRTCLLGEEDVALFKTKAVLDESNLLSILEIPEYTVLPDALVRSIDVVLNQTPNFESKILELVHDGELSKWIEDGLSLHNDTEHCKFCTREIPGKRLDELRQHFSGEVSAINIEIDSLVEIVKALKPNSVVPNDQAVYPEFRPALREIREPLAESQEKLSDYLVSLEDALLTKKNSIFEAVALPLSEDWSETTHEKHVSDLAKLLQKNNAVTENYENEKRASSDKIRLHMAAEFYRDTDLDKLARQQELREKNLQKLKGYRGTLVQETAALEAKISNAQKGKDQLNVNLSKLLGGSLIRIEVVSDESGDRFKLLRGAETATKLSEGEKTAIALSYFLVKLREIAKWSRLVVYLDDPISSLDSNHLFQVNAMLREEFFFQDNNQENKWVLRICQLFVSTHNFEFLKLLRELPISNGKNTIRRRSYIVARESKVESSFLDMPDSMDRYDTEYQYLWDLIQRSSKSANSGDMDALLTLPNAIRRFVELYTYSRLPTHSQDTVDKRAGSLFGAEKSKRLLKLLHLYSHGNNMNGADLGADLLGDIDNVVLELTDLLKSTDPVHYEALMSSI